MLYTEFDVPIMPGLLKYKGLLVTLFIVMMSFLVSAQQMPPLKILLNFSEPMSRENIFNPCNYIVTANENIIVEVIKVGLVEGDSAVVLFINKGDDWYNFKITVHNLKDKAGNLINDKKNYAEFTTAFTTTFINSAAIKITGR
jgi:hypothetical protein